MNSKQKLPGPLIVAIIFFVLASGLAAFLLFVAIRNGPVAGCGRSCDMVMKSRWAYLLPGVPVTVPALLMYLVLLYGLIFKPRSEVWQGVFLVGALMVIGAAIWFIGLQIVVIKSYCKWCLLTHACGMAGAVCLLLGLKTVPRELKPFGIAAAAMGLAMLAACQLLLPQKTTADTRINAGMGPGKIVDVGGLKLDIGQMPYRGNPDAEAGKRMVLMFDYTCASCRRVHGYLSRAEERFGKDNYLVVMLPVPLNPDCNRHIKEPMPDHRDACLFAQMAFALWATDTEKFYEYDKWMIETGSSRYPPAADAARAKAEELIGKEALAKAMDDPGVDAKVEHVSKLWNVLREKTGRMAMPKMLWGDGVLTDGASGSEFELFNTMEAHMGVKRLN